MGDTKTFQIVFISICIILTIAGVFVFSFGGTKDDGSSSTGATAIIWGTEDEKTINELLNLVNVGGKTVVNAEYVQKDAETFNQILLEALATGRGPDAILASAEDLLTYEDKILTIPFGTLSERDFKDSFIEEGELFRTGKGFLAVPFSVDPLVLYWNRDIFTIHDKTSPPANWSTVVSLVPEMRDISEDLTIFEAVISLGDYRNINNAKAILSALMLQSGTSITSLDYKPDYDRLILASELNGSSRDTLVIPAVATLNFYTQFADPLSKVYAWNRSLPNSLDMFASDDLAMYIGFGSEANLIRSKNPNLNFDMALFPQSSASVVPVTYGKMLGLAILSSSKNQVGAYQAISALTAAPFMKIYADGTGLPPVRRDLLSMIPGTAEGNILYKSALYSRGFLDPSPVKTASIFQTMVESVLSGRLISSAAVLNADQQFRLLVNDFNLKQELK